MKPIHIIAILSQVITAFVISALFIGVQSARPKDVVMHRLLPKDIASMETEWMQAELSLTTRQRSQIVCINLEIAETIHKTINTFGPEMSSEKVEITLMQKEKQLKQIFTTAQWQVYQAKKIRLLQPVRFSMQEKP